MKFEFREFENQVLIDLCFLHYPLYVIKVHIQMHDIV